MELQLTAVPLGQGEPADPIAVSPRSEADIGDYTYKQWRRGPLRAPAQSCKRHAPWPRLQFLHDV